MAGSGCSGGAGHSSQRGGIAYSAGFLAGTGPGSHSSSTYTGGVTNSSSTGDTNCNILSVSMMISPLNSFRTPIISVGPNWKLRSARRCEHHTLYQPRLTLVTVLW